MRFFSLLILIAFIFFPPLIVSSQESIIKDNFPEGKPELRWAPFPFFNLDNLKGSRDNNAPDRDNGIGILNNSNAGGFASLSYAVTRQVHNFYLEAVVYCNVTKGDKGPLTGIAFLIDPIKGSFYRFICNFKTGDPVLNLAYVGIDTRNYPVYLKIWDSKDIPGRVPKKSGWHKMSVRVKEGKAVLYWEGKELKGGPFIVDKIQRGFVGVYANFVGGLGEANTKVDSFKLKPDYSK